MVEPYGQAYNPANTLAGGSDSSGKVEPDGSICDIYSPNTDLKCDISTRPVPACCSSEDNSASCDSFDNGAAVSCSKYAEPYPACCENR